MTPDHVGPLDLLEAALDASGTLPTALPRRAVALVDRLFIAVPGSLPSPTTASFPLLLAALDAIAGLPQPAAHYDTPFRSAPPLPAAGTAAPALLAAALAATRNGS